ncbi:MAG: hypothetical protein U5N85_17515 [Arcicella sp.]|nr:hypothetical protein [Arcicella sp.]
MKLRISVYLANHQDNSIPLGDVFLAIREKHGEKVEVNVKTSSDAELFDFLDTVAPDFDRDKVFPSDVKKMINWYNILSANMPAVFEPAAEEEPVISEEPAVAAK